ncbi:MAG: ABC transporter permease [Ignavibacteria bacterium]|nr:ABC transporter permease [Ignavibacteria bacterium]
MLWKLAWRNIWRNKRRSLIVLVSIVIGMASLIFFDGFSNGMMQQMLSNQISSNISHIQIHKKGFNDNKIIKNILPDRQKVEQILKENAQVKFFSERVITFGLLSSASSSSGIYLYGIKPGAEEKISKIKTSIVEGNYLSDAKRDILIGKKLAEKLNVGLGDKVVAMANTPDGSIGSDVFRVTGIFETFSSEFDRSTIYISEQTAQNMLGIDNETLEFAMIIEDFKKVDEVKANLQLKLGDEYEVLSYKDLLPMIIFSMDIYQESMFIFNLIIGLALIFGIINTMLMSVFERINEFGVLMAMGMKNSRLFFMIVLEAFIIGIVGTIVGLIVGILIHIPLSHSGIDFSLFAEGLESFGVGAIIYPILSLGNLISMIFLIPFISVAGALYPAYRAIKLEPVYAINYV